MIFPSAFNGPRVHLLGIKSWPLHEDATDKMQEERKRRKKAGASHQAADLNLGRNEFGCGSCHHSGGKVIQATLAKRLEGNADSNRTANIGHRINSNGK